VGDSDGVQLIDFGLVKVRHVEEWRLVQPLSLDQHLKDVDQIHGRR